MNRQAPPEIARMFELEPAPDLPPHDSKWLRCANFVVRRSSGRRGSNAHAE
jgi:hypothetical protein